MIFSYEKEDFQDETFKIIASLIADAIQSQREKDPFRLFANIDALYVASNNRVDKKVSKKGSDVASFEDRLMKVMVRLYPKDGHLLSSQERTVLFLDLRLLWKELAGILDEQGLMFRARSSPHDMILRD